MIQTTTEEYLYAMTVVGYIVSLLTTGYRHDWTKFNGRMTSRFKKDYSSVDHMFILMAMIQKQFALNRKLYVAFIDFEKAFDSILRKLL